MEAVLHAEWVAPSIARDRVRQWLTGHRWSPTHRDDLVLAISEAVSNSVEHGYGITADSDLTTRSNTSEIHGHLIITHSDGAPRVVFTIRDYVRGIPPAALRDKRGHGLTILRACTDEVIIDPTAHGTTVVLRSRPLPPPPLRPV
jgi:anti-sigma regulatory factor (Ser/Thr protein kinase)